MMAGAADIETDNDIKCDAGVMQEALTSDKERLFSVIQNDREEVLLGALRSPVIDHQHLLALLKRRGLGPVITAIYVRKRLIEACKVRYALLPFMEILILLAAILFGCICHVSVEAAEYGVARVSTSVLNSPDFSAIFGGESGNELKTDRCGQVRELEYMALPGTVFRLLGKQRSGTGDIYQVETDEYTAPANVRLYVAGRFLQLGLAAPLPRRRTLLPRETVVAMLRASGGRPYVWGGNVPDGVPELESWFYSGVDESNRKRLTLAGLDCSGLLYHATGGWTPRNTSQLINFGQGVAIAGKSAAEIAALLQPLDLIVWNGHVVIVLDRQTAIESRLQCGGPGNGGVVMTELAARVAAVMRTSRPVNAWQGGEKKQNIFVVRRWYVGY